MARNGSGTYSIPNSFTSGTTASSSAVNANFTDIGSEITGSLPRDGQAAMTGQLKSASGTAAAPGITFSSDLDCGFYRKGANNVAMALNGADVIDATTTGVSITGTVIISGAVAAASLTVGGASVGAMPPGVVMDYLGTAAPTGWVMLDGLTIGNASSSGTSRANADTSDLFTLLWNSTANAECAVSSGRGASAAADYAANKTIALPDARGRARFGKDNMSGSTAGRVTSAGSGVTGTTLATSGGAETQTLTVAQLPVVTPAGTIVSTPNTNFLRQALQGGVAGGGSTNVQDYVSNTTLTITSTFTGTPFGSGAAHPNLPPALITNVIIKL